MNPGISIRICQLKANLTRLPNSNCFYFVLIQIDVFIFLHQRTQSSYARWSFWLNCIQTFVAHNLLYVEPISFSQFFGRHGLKAKTVVPNVEEDLMALSQ